jgi:hypothetical protein
MGSNVGFHARSKSKTNYQHASKTQAHIVSGVVLVACILRPLAIANKSTQTYPILVYLKSLKYKEHKGLAPKRLALSKKSALEHTANNKENSSSKKAS